MIAIVHLNETQLEFVKQLLNNPQLTVPVLHAKVAGEVHTIFNDVKASEPQTP